MNREDQLEIGIIGDSLRHAYKMCETDSQRRGVERATAALAVTFSKRYSGFSQKAFTDWVKYNG